VSESKVIKKLESLIDEKIKEESVSKISSKLFFNYSRMVVKERAIPEVADGLKVVHRRIIFVMSKLATHDFKKSARIVGETMGKFHPHGDLSIYQSLIRLARPFSIRYPLIIGQGNFGSLDGDNPAAMRYTEARLSKISTNFFLSFLHSGCADFISNYDNNEFEPYQIPTLFPFLLVNGASGIGVGVRSFLPSHNLGEIVQTLIHVLDNPAATLDEILGKKFFGPDLPLRGKILFENLESLKKIYSEGRGILNVLAPINIEKKKS